MADLLNQVTQKPEPVPPELVLDALRSGKYALPMGGRIDVVSPTGEIGSLPNESFVESISKYGYRLPTSQEIAKDQQHRMYGEGFANEVKAGLAAAGRGLSFGLTDLALTKSGLVEPETLAGLKEENPLISGITEMGTIGASILLAPGASLPGLLSRGAAKAGAKMVGAKAAGLAIEGGVAQKIAGMAIGSAIEGATYGAGQTVTEAALGDPDLNAQKIFSNIGMAALLGGALGGGVTALGAGASKGRSWLLGKFGRAAEVPEVPPAGAAPAATVAEEAVQTPEAYRSTYLSKRAPVSSQGWPSNSMVEANVPISGQVVQESPSLASTLEPAGASSSTQYMRPSHLNSFDGLATYDGNPVSLQDNYTAHYALSKANEQPFVVHLEQATGFTPSVRIKSEIRYLDKVKRYQKAGLDPSTIADMIGGRVVVEPGEIAAALEKVHKSFDVLETQDFFHSPTSFGYRGINMRVRLPNGQLAEVQIHTPESVAAVPHQHPIYEKWQDRDVNTLTPKELAERRADQLKSRQFYRDAEDGTLFERELGAKAKPEVMTAPKVKASPDDIEIAKNIRPDKDPGFILPEEVAEIRANQKLYVMPGQDKAIPDGLLGTAKIPTADEGLALLPNGKVPVKVSGAIVEDMDKFRMHLEQRELAAQDMIANSGVEIPKSDVLDLLSAHKAELEAIGGEEAPIVQAAIKDVDQRIKLIKKSKRDVWSGEYMRTYNQRLREEIKEYRSGRMPGSEPGFKERQLKQITGKINEDLRGRLKEIYGDNRFGDLMDTYSREIEVYKDLKKQLRWDRATNRSLLGSDAIQNRILTPLQKTTEGYVPSFWAKNLNDFSKIVGRDWQQIAKSNLLFGKAFPEMARGGQRGSFSSALFKGLWRSLVHPVEMVKGVGAKAGETMIDLAHGEAPEIMIEIQRLGAQDMLLGKTTTAGKASSLYKMIHKAVKDGSDLFKETGPLRQLLVPESIKALQLLDDSESLDEADRKVETLIALERARNDADKKITSAVNGLFKGEPDKNEVPQRFTNFLNDKSPDQHATEYEKIYSDLTELFNNPELLLDRMEQNMAGLENVAPDHAVALNATATRGVQFLAGKLSIPDKKALDRPYTPSKPELIQFAKYAKAVNDPYQILRELKRGTISKETMEAVASVHPDLLAYLQAQVVAKLSEHSASKKPINNSRRLTLAYFLGADMDRSTLPQAVAKNFAMLSGAAAAEPKGGGGGPRAGAAKNITLSARSMTPMTKVANR